MSFFGTDYTSVYINSNGNLTFDSPNTSYTPSGISGFAEPMIAPLFTDINIASGSATGTNNIYWDLDAANGVFTVTWLGVDPYSGGGENTFQVRITSLPGGGSDIEFIYEDIQFSSGGSGQATAGITDGGANDYELTGSGNGTAVLNYETQDFGTGDAPGVYSQALSPTGAPVCFLEGTLIRTKDGERPIEHLMAGDEILTVDRGLKPIEWIGSRHYTARQLHHVPSLVPVRLGKGALGAETPYRPLWVTQQHRVLLGETEQETGVLAPAKALTGLNGVSKRCPTLGGLTYFHILMEGHQIIWANGLRCETLLMGRQAKLSLGHRAYREIMGLPAASKATNPCREVLSVRAARAVVRQMKAIAASQPVDDDAHVPGLEILSSERGSRKSVRYVH